MSSLFILFSLSIGALSVSVALFQDLNRSMLAVSKIDVYYDS